MINFVLEYWFIAALVVAAWAWWKFATYNSRRNSKNTLAKFGAPPIRRTPKQTEQDVQKIIEKLINEMK